MAFGVKTNERPGTRAVVRYVRMSAFKARPVLDLIRDEPVGKADEILSLTERSAADVVRKCLASAVANAGNNEDIPPDELYVSACYADEGPTLKRWRPRARGRATRIRKRTCHITVVVSRMSTDRYERLRAETSGRPGAPRRRGDAAEDRRRRVAASRGDEAPAEDEVPEEEEVTETAAVEAPVEETTAVEEAEVTETPAADTDDEAADEAETAAAADASDDEDDEDPAEREES
ncbi:MAG: 50S ribosomal protein L22 [Actinomycetota bacterium]|nr:50S ribosomal protein L22 [Actinomycetota bacterium]